MGAEEARGRFNRDSSRPTFRPARAPRVFRADVHAVPPRDLVLPNRVVVFSDCQYVDDEGTVGDWHLVHLGSRAIGGAGLVMAEMTDVCPDGRISPWCAGSISRSTPRRGSASSSS